MKRCNPAIFLSRMAYLLVCVIMFSPGASFAAPTISAVSGSVISGGSITITGLDFGANGPSIVVFDDFESGTNGTPIKLGTGSATVGEWSSKRSGTTYYTDSISHSGSLAFQAASGTPSYPNGYISVRAKFEPTNEFFGTWWVYLPPEDEWPGERTGTATGGSSNTLVDTSVDFTSWSLSPGFIVRKEGSGGSATIGSISSNTLTFSSSSITFSAGDKYYIASLQGGANWKQIWVHSGQVGAQCSDVDAVLPTAFHNGSGALCGNCSGGYTAYGQNMAKGQWKRQMIYWRGSQSGSGAVHSSYLHEGTPMVVHREDNSVTNMGSSSYNTYSVIDIGAYCHQTMGAVSHPTIDDFYFAVGPNCRARVEIGNNSVYRNCTNLTVTTPTSWSNSQITTILRQGSFRSGDQAYLFVVKADGTMSEGYPIQFGGTSSTIGSPTNLEMR